MAVIAPSVIFLVAALFLPAAVSADQASDLRAQLGHITSALSDGNPSDALSVFDKSFRDYEKLGGYFEGLTSAFQVGSEIDIVDETDSPNTPEVTVNWTLTLTDQTTEHSERRTSTEHLRFASLDGKWKIVDLSPIDLFNPEQPKK